MGHVGSYGQPATKEHAKHCAVYVCDSMKLQNLSVVNISCIILPGTAYLYVYLY